MPVYSKLLSAVALVSLVVSGSAQGALRGNDGITAPVIAAHMNLCGTWTCGDKHIDECPAC